eukprot:5516695-Pyramimonas_sp.AAC.1
MEGPRASSVIVDHPVVVARLPRVNLLLDHLVGSRVDVSNDALQRAGVQGRRCLRQGSEDGDRVQLVLVGGQNQ